MTYNVNRTISQYGQYDYPTYITPNASSQHRVSVTFDYDRSIDDITALFPPLEIKVLAFTDALFGTTCAPCEHKFSTPRPKWTGFLKIFLAVIANNVQKESFANSNYTIYLLSGMTRNELMASGLKDLAPNLTDSEIGYLSRGLFSFFDGDFTGLTNSALREKLHQTLLDNVNSMDLQTMFKMLDVIIGLCVAKKRGQ